MKQRIRLTESDLHKIVKESVNMILNEVFTDTIASARDSAKDKWSKLRSKYPFNNPRVERAYDQYDNFNKEYQQRYNSGNEAKKARMQKNLEDIRNGVRKYKSGVGWQNGE